MTSSSAAAPLLRAPLIVERYAIYDEIASGGMATVHFARLLGAQGFRRTVAAKRLLPHLTRDHDFSLMLIDEARLAARIRHPNVVSTLDVVQTDSELVLVMDYVHGESLSKLVRAAKTRGETVPLPITCAILIDTLHGLHAAHEANDERGQPLGIVHRDISPQNLLVGTDGITRIADFGIAKAAGRSQTTQDGSIKGKLSYMAPEQVTHGKVSRVTDVFAASVVLWELLTGQRLFEGGNQAESLFRVMSQPIPAPSSLVPSLPRELDRIVARGLSREPEQRFPTAREMALALEDCAPQIRPSEIASWVERIAQDSLARRSLLLSAIEHSPHDLADAEGRTEHVDIRALAANDLKSPASGVAVPALTPGAGVQDRARARAEAGDAYPPFKKQTSPLVKFAAVGLLLTIVVVGLALYFTPHEGVRPSATPLGEDARVVAPAAAVHHTQTVTRSEDTQVTRPVAQPVEPQALEPADEPKDAPEDKAESEADEPEPRSDKPSGRKSGRSPRNHKNVSCDPPYSIEAQGRRIFKVECM
jgi:serine/threonine-protein kinase